MHSKSTYPADIYPPYLVGLFNVVFSQCLEKRYSQKRLKKAGMRALLKKRCHNDAIRERCSLLRLGAERALLLQHLLLLLAQLLVDLGALGWLVAVLSGLWGVVSVVLHG